MDYSILNVLGELSPFQFLHNFIHVAVCLKKKQVGRKWWIYLALKHYTIIKASKNVYFTEKQKLFVIHHMYMVTFLK